MSTVLFTLIAYAQVSNQIKLNDFHIHLDLDLRHDSWTSDEDFAQVENENTSVHLWKWIMDLYLTSFSFSLLDFIVFWGEECFKNVRDEMDWQDAPRNKIQSYLLHSVPLALFMLEYPCNMIPINLRLFPFVCIIMVAYFVCSLFYNFLASLPVYGPMDWQKYPLQAACVCLTGFLLEIILCFLIWFLTEKVKLPFYRKRQERKSEQLIEGFAED